MTPACKFRDSFQAPEPLSQFWWYPVCLLTTGRSLRRGTRPSASLDRGIKPFYWVKLSSECVAIIAICSSSVDIYEPPHNARRAYNQTLPAVKTGHPLRRDRISLKWVQRYEKPGRKPNLSELYQNVLVTIESFIRNQSIAIYHIKLEYSTTNLKNSYN